MESFEVPDAVLGPRDVLAVAGPDAADYLHSQIAQDLRPLAVGERTWTLVLEPAGKVAGFARVTRTADDRFELDTDAGFGESLRQRLDRFRIRVRAEIDLVPAADDATPRDDAARIELGWPALGSEIVPGDTIPAATGLAGIAVSFTKGCYPGQELVERMDSRGSTAPATLRRLVVEIGAAAGDPISVEGTDVGTLTSVSGTAALGYVQRTVELGEVVRF